ncbi:hypothetical protein C8R32_102252 [Nitrosospira sp. Nsp5]|uniref:Uncharacterized protein n=1 Tax=Nitrosospira multiformis TaxID=1231 RepID=A0ABY0TK44_9PROT|nr:hypothetical protein C8R32_102252 [Nitrosospira sp. Nsp5]SDQ96044.1 hypothetical protein SAMN05216402_3004 [Nitrosospira multiformis]
MEFNSGNCISADPSDNHRAACFVAFVIRTVSTLTVVTRMSKSIISRRALQYGRQISLNCSTARKSAISGRWKLKKSASRVVGTSGCVGHFTAQGIFALHQNSGYVIREDDAVLRIASPEFFYNLIIKSSFVSCRLSLPLLHLVENP